MNIRDYTPEALHRKSTQLQGMVTEQQLRNHDWSNNARNGNSTVVALSYIENNIPNAFERDDAEAEVQQRFSDIVGLNGFQIRALDLGVTREAMEGFEWFSDDTNRLLATRALDYLERCPPEIVIGQAMDRIRDAESGRDIMRLQRTQDYGQRENNLSR